MSEIITDIDIIEDDITSSENYITTKDEKKIGKKRLYIESYGCQMNFSDSEIVSSIMKKEGFDTTSNFEDADLIFLNTCSIREKAELTVRKRLEFFNSIKRRKPELKIGVLGCMAERLKTKLLEEEKMVDIVAGPDAYRDLPNLLMEVEDGYKAINTFLSREETYADISPVRLNSNGITAFISIMRGCDNMCSFCVVPLTRGRERSRSPHSIIEEARDLYSRGFREVTLLGQNVDSYKWSETENNKARLEKKEAQLSAIVNFANLLEMVALVHPDLRIRFSTSHPKDITNEVLHTMKKYENICKYIHLPVQSGSSRILEMMNRTYDRDWYIDRVDAIREILGDECGISSDMISGFCTETEDDHQDTLSLMDYVQFDYSYMFYYSEREGTPAAKKYVDDVSLELKKRRLTEIIAKQRASSLAKNQRDVGKSFKVLIESASKKSEDYLQGRNSANKVIVFPRENYTIGSYANIKVIDCTGGTLLGESVATK
jgi:tRNA-2-methylthio-N6-dimethylallyladenosine synthase